MRTPSLPYPSALRPAVFALLLLTAAAAAPAPAAGLREVLRYDLFSGRDFGSSGEMEAVAGPDGHVLLVWTEGEPGTFEQSTWARWLGPDGGPSGRTIRVVASGGTEGVAVRAGRRAIVLTRDSQTGSPLHVVTLEGDRVVRRGRLPGPQCNSTDAAAATELGYFVVCTRWTPEERRTFGWWLAGSGRARRQVELDESDSVLAVAGGVRNTVAVIYQRFGDEALYGRWLAPWSSGPEIVFEPVPGASGPSDPAITHLGDRVFAVAWVHELEAGLDGEDLWRVTAVHEALFRGPATVRAERRLSAPSDGPGLHADALSEHRRPFVLRTGDRDRLVGWFACRYGSSPGGVICFPRDGLFLRARGPAGPSGRVISLPDVGWESRVVHTGDLLLAVRLVPSASEKDRWSLEVRGWTMQ